ISAFGSERKPIGDELNGREINLYRIKDRSFTNLMARFDSYYSKLQKDAMDDPEKEKELEEVNKLLSGKQMTKEAFTGFMKNKLGVSGPKANALYDQMRMDESVAMEDDMWVDIPPLEDPNAGKSKRQIEVEKAEEEAAFRNTLEDRLYKGELFEKAEEEPEAEVPGDQSFDLSADFFDGEEMHGWKPEAQQNGDLDTGVTLADYLTTASQRLARAEKPEVQDKIVRSMISAVHLAGGGYDKEIDTAGIDPGKIAKIPSVAYQFRHNRDSIIEKAKTGSVEDIFRETVSMNSMLMGDPVDNAQSMEKLKALYNSMNVPDLKSRSKEYQSMVKTLQQVTRKKELTGEDKLKVINAVENYAGKKRVVPRTDDGKKSLDLAHQAMEAVVPSREKDLETNTKFLRPHRQNVTQLRNAMIRDGLMPRPQQEAAQNEGPVR
ncbi:MAG: hypothetical protein IJJ75_07715, partial [Firmicutes bacterium]|nr:hypothetical protein [Bacillota bacterium]